MVGATHSVNALSLSVVFYSEHCLASLTCLPSTMHYSNLRNEAEVPEPRVDPGSSAAKLALGPGDELFKKRESYWFLALVVVLVLIGSIVFYCAHTGGQDTQLTYYSLLLVPLRQCRQGRATPCPRATATRSPPPPRPPPPPAPPPAPRSCYTQTQSSSTTR